MKIKAFLIAVLILIGLFAIGFFTINFVMKLSVGHRNEVLVPDLTRMNFDMAVKKCNDMKLYVETKETVNNDDVEKGHIISQDPHPGIDTKRYRTIDVVVSDGPEMVRVPFLENLSVSEAKLRLQNVGLALGKVNYRYHDIVEKDRLIYSQPNADALLARKSKVEVFVSLGKLANSGSSSDKWKNLLEDSDG